MELYRDLCRQLSAAGWVDAERYEGRKQDKIVMWMNIKTQEIMLVHVDADHEFVLAKYARVS